MTTSLSRAEQEALATNDPVLRKMLDEERIESEEVDIKLFFRLLGYLRPHKQAAATAVVLSLAESFLMTLPAYVVGLALDRAQGKDVRKAQVFDGLLDTIATSTAQWFDVGDPRTRTVIVFGVILLVVWAARWFIAIVTTFLVQKLGQRVVHGLRVDIFNHISSQGLDFFHRNPVGRLVNRTTFDVQSLSELFSDAFAQGMRDIMFVTVLTIVMFTLDPVLAALLLGSFPFLILVALGYRKLARPSLRTMSAIQSRMNGWLAENISGMRENQLYRREGRRAAEWHALTEAHQSSVYRVLQAWGLLRPGMMLVSGIATAGVLGVGYERVVTEAISVGVLITFLEYTSRIWVPVRNLTEKFNVIQTALTAGERVFDVLNTRSNMVDADDADMSLTVERGEVEFRDVVFRYPKTHEDVLKGLSFLAKPGQKIGLVGDTGAGKSTIISLLSRFYDVTSGAVLVDGHDVRKFHLQALRSGIALVPQDVVVFAGTVRENITLGAPHSDEEVMECIRAVSAESLVSRFEHGLDHVFEEGGRTLSAGERQLISFARALLVNPPILILDEATASIDTRTETEIQRALERLTRDRTTIVIAHRLSTIRDADQILVLRKGVVVERGNHPELMNLDGYYASLYRAHTH
ncbi:MAG: ABC transporter ATP-binding protein [bacterium]